MSYAEKFGASFTLVKSDLGGNIDRLETARQKDIQKYGSLYMIILDEIDRKEQGNKYSDSKALLWLNRYIVHLSKLTNFCIITGLLLSYRIYEDGVKQR